MLVLWMTVADAQSMKLQLSDSTVISGIRIRVTNLNRQDETFLDLTPGHDTVAVSKLDNPGITLALGTAFNRYSIAGRAMVEEAGIIPLDLRRPGFQNTMTILKSGPESGFYAIYFKDDYEGTITYLSEDSSTFDFFATGSDQSRFSLLIQSSATGNYTESSIPFMSCPPPMAEFISLNLPGPGSITFTELGGKSIHHPISEKTNNIILSTLPSGIYRLSGSGFRNTCLIIRK